MRPSSPNTRAQFEISPDAIVLLKEALSKLFWYKKDLRSFLEKSIPDPSPHFAAELGRQQIQYSKTIGGLSCSGQEC